MPSEDKYHEENPRTNRWLEALSPDELGKLSETAYGNFVRAGLKSPKRPMAAHIQKLATRLGVAAEKIAEKIPDDTMRRLKFSMLEQKQEDGTRQYSHDVGIIRDGVRPLLATDHSDEPITQNAPRLRDDSGRFKSSQ